MMNMNNEEYKKYISCINKMISKYGKEMQYIVLIEELSELQKATTKILRKYKNCNFNDKSLDNLYEDMIEEICDVDIMLDVMKEMHKSINIRNRIKLKMKEKIKRFNNRSE